MMRCSGTSNAHLIELAFSQSWIFHNLPSKLVTIPNPRAWDERLEFVFDSAGFPNRQDLASLLSTVANEDL
jgi:hypothetical protein